MVITTFKNGCMCGGYAWTMNGRDPEQPHMLWCPQFEEYAEWRAQQKKDPPPVLGHDSF